MSSLLYPGYTLAYLVLLAFGAWLLVRRPRASTAIVIAVTFGVFWDNLVLSIGGAIGEGDLLHALSVPRFALHQVVLPWLIVAGWSMAAQAGFGWARRSGVRAGAVVLSLAVMLAGIATRLLGVTFVPDVVDGVLRYVAVGIKGPPIVSIVSIAVVGTIGVGFWRRVSWPWITLASIAVAVGEAFPDEGVRRVVGSAVEVVFMAVLLETTRRLDAARLHVPREA